MDADDSSDAELDAWPPDRGGSPRPSAIFRMTRERSLNHRISYRLVAEDYNSFGPKCLSGFLRSRPQRFSDTVHGSRDRMSSFGRSVAESVLGVVVSRGKCRIRGTGSCHCPAIPVFILSHRSPPQPCRQRS